LGPPPAACRAYTAAVTLPVVPASLRAVLLDLGETLVRPEPSWRDVYATVFRAWGIEADADAFERAFAESWSEWEHEGPFEATEEASFQRLMELDRLVFGRLGHPGLPEAFFRDIDRAFHRRAAWFIFPDVGPALGALRDAGLRLAVVSNWGWTAPELLHLLELAGHFDAFAISARGGYQKPHPALFRHALDALAVAADDAIHVGDNPAADVAGAQRAGVAPVLIDRHGRHAADRVPVIRDLCELLDLLGIERPAPAAVP
jgi:HAD superfamily hydrolase (TIGR01509 family)